VLGVDEFKEAIRAAGLRPPEQIKPGEWHRFPGIGKRKGLAGWCKLFPDGRGGVFGDYSTNLSEEWQQDRERAPLTSPKKREFQRLVEQAKKEAAATRQAENEQAAAIARGKWNKAGPALHNHPYLVKKHLSGQGLRQSMGKLLVPLRDQSGELWAIQTIDQYGGKLFQPKGCRTSGLYCVIGDKPSEGCPVCICEGWATGAAINEATGQPVAVAFNASNLGAVARIIHEKFPENPVIICADDDQKEGASSNPGMEAARKAAENISGCIAEPGMGRKADFWDLWQSGGPAAIFEALQKALSETGGKYLQSEVFSIEDSLRAAGALVEQTKGDCGAPFTSESLRLLASIRSNDKGAFMRVRQDLKKANRALVLAELDRDVSRALSKSCFSLASSSFSISYDAFTPELKDSILQFKDKLITCGDDGKLGLVPHSVAASLIGETLRGRYAFNEAAACWHAFDGSCWRQCSGNGFERAVIALLYEGAGEVGFSANYQAGVVLLLQKSGLLCLPPVNPRVIPFANGLLDPATGMLQAVTADNAQTWALPFRYSPAASCPNFLSWLHLSVDGDKETVHLLRAWLNALIVGRADLQIFLHLIGPAGTGKSTFGRLAFFLVGNENATTTTLRELERNKFETANIFGKRLVAIEEADKYGGSVGVLKALTGQDPLRLERKNQQQQGSFIYGGQVMILSNELVASTDYTSGIERRRVTVEFQRQITILERLDWENKGGEEGVLFSEAAGIIRWSLELTREQVSQIFRDCPGRVRKANLGAARFNNPVVDWMLSCLLPGHECCVQVGVKEEVRTDGEVIFKYANDRLYPSYLTWCLQSGREFISLQRFSRALVDAARSYGVTVNKKKEAQGVFVYGLRIRRNQESSWMERIEGECGSSWL
jgi:putative DNA primase/helicase